jgi:hypothetical protein
MTCNRHLDRVRDRLGFFVRNHFTEVPAWDARDRRQFFGQFGGELGRGAEEGAGEWKRERGELLRT